ncbi:isopenicillin N synthase family oxygenase, partial [Francisella tularensis subsp. holarctica]|nr:isopenicillin N synthase family oxygenase [Francisella tularensis subsp. holarctica]
MKILSVYKYADDADELFTRSLKETRFAVLRTHHIDWNLIQTVYKEWQEFFKSGSADKYIYDVENQV